MDDSFPVTKDFYILLTISTCQDLISGLRLWFHNILLFLVEQIESYTLSICFEKGKKVGSGYVRFFFLGKLTLY